MELQSIKNELQLLKCPYCSKKAGVSVKGNSIEFSNICCEKFKKILDAKTQELIKKQIDKSVDNLFKNL